MIKSKCVYVADDGSHHDTTEGALSRNKFVAIAAILRVANNGYDMSPSTAADLVVKHFNKIKDIMNRTS